MKQVSNKPTRKVIAGTSALVFLSVLYYVLGQVGVELPELNEQTTALISAIIAFIAQYFTPPGENDGIEKK